MRKIVFFIFTVCLSFLFIMCNSEEKPPIQGIEEPESIFEISGEGNTLEKWVKSNSETLKTYKREELALYSRSVQKAIMRSFSPEKRKSIWQAKINYLMSSPHFSYEEIKYLEWFAKKFESLSYDKASSKEESQEMYDKVMEGSVKFGWSNDQIHKMFFTIGDITNTDDQKNKAQIKPAPSDDSNGTWCECLYDMGCPTWNCNKYADCDNSAGSPHECGVFNTSDCEGNC